MATQASPPSFRTKPIVANPGPVISKRKRPVKRTRDSDGPQPKKRVNLGQTPAQHAAETVQLTHSSVLGQMSRSYHTEMLSVISSSSIKGRVDSILRHLSQFHPTDMSVLPGVVLLHSGVRCAQKLFTIVEIAKRRIHEMDQKWYQYNQLHQIQVDVRPEDLSRIEETAMGHVNNGDEEHEDSEEDDAFEPLLVQTHQQDSGHHGRPQLFLSVFLSRVPIPEFHGKAEYTMQTNADQLEVERASRMGRPTVNTGRHL